ncbi:MAG: glycoside hydrolase family 26 protein [Candidatus Eremiobacteraeota bacterium]|nr:glycoside hydrolase family 26 protein [Candidatus Eremiobacteraeota bacterium]
MNHRVRFGVRAAVCALLAMSSAGCGGANLTPQSLAPSAPYARTFDASSGSGLSSLPVLRDTNPSTSGVFLGEVCDQSSVVPCPAFENTFRHGIAVGTVYADWSADLADLVKNQALLSWRAAGISPEITWQPTNAVTFDDINRGKYDSYFTLSAQELKRFGSTIYLRPFHEFNGSWYSWGLVNQGADAAADRAFVAAWQRMVGIFHNAGAANVKFVWCFSTGGLANTEAWDNPTNVYPGDEYVDWISFDTYNRGNKITGTKWKSFDEIAAAPYQLATSISTKRPVSISELASTEYGDGGSMKSAWIKHMLEELQSAHSPYPHLRLISWFDTDIKGYMYDLQSTSPVYGTFVNGIRGRNSQGLLYFRSNASALSKLVSI